MPLLETNNSRTGKILALMLAHMFNDYLVSLRSARAATDQLLTQ